MICNDGLEYIGAYAFSQCAALKEVTLPESIAFIDCNIFNICPSLENITFENPNADWQIILPSWETERVYVDNPSDNVSLFTYYYYNCCWQKI